MKIFRGLFDRVNIIPIITNHFNTLYNYNLFYNENRRVITKQDKFLFILFPILVSTILLFGFNLRFDKDKISLLVTSLSIFTGLMLSLLVLIFDIGRKEKDILNSLPVDEIVKKKASGKKITLIREIFSNVLYSVLVSAFCIIFCYLTQLKRVDVVYSMIPNNVYFFIKTIYIYLTHLTALFLIIQFFLVLLMIFKRFKLLFDLEFED